jgi:hypothetical protein
LAKVRGRGAAALVELEVIEVALSAKIVRPISDKDLTGDRLFPK